MLRPIVDLANPLVSGASLSQLDLLETFAATQLRKTDFPQTLKVAHDLYVQVLEPTNTPVVTDFDRARIERWVNNKECERPDSNNPELRAAQIIDSFDTAVDNWSVQNGQPEDFLFFRRVQEHAQPKRRETC